MTREERDKTIRLMRESGVTLESIGAAFGLSKQRVHEILKGRTGRFHWTAQSDAVLREMHAQGSSVAAMASALGCPYGAARFRLDTLDLLPWTQARVKHLRRLVADGESMREICKTLGAPKAAVLREMERGGISFGTRVRAPAAPCSRPDQGLASSEMQRRRIVSLAAKGWPAADVARQVRCEVQFVEEVLA